MASITVRAGRFTARVRRKGYALAAKTFTRRSDAQAWARQVEVAMERGDWVDPSQAVPSLKDAIKGYRQAIGDKLKGATTYAYRWDEISALAFASKLVTEVSARDLSQWRDAELTKGLKPGTVVRKLALLSSVLSWCLKERGWLQVNPASLVRRPRVSDSRDRTLTATETEYLLSAAGTSKATWLAPALVVLMRSAMRRGELCALRRGDVDFENATAHLADTKNGLPRDVPLCPQALEALRVLDKAAEVRGDLALVPVGALGSVSIRFNVTVKRARTQYVKDCGARSEDVDPLFLMNLRLHDLRHHACSMWAQTGGLSLFELMAISGHTQPKMLSRYVNLKASDLAAKLHTLTAPAAF